MGRNTARVVIISEDCIYTIKRMVKGRPQYFSIPGGGIEKGESPEEAAKREIKEELGVDVKLIDKLGVYPGGDGMHHIFIGIPTGGEFGTGKGEEYENMDLDNFFVPYKLPISQVGLVHLNIYRCQDDLVAYLAKLKGEK